MTKNAIKPTQDVARLQLDDDVVMQLGEKMYSQDQYFVLLRECMQNSLDAGATTITIKTDYDWWMTMEDNGCGMTKEQLLSTFLTIGGSNKLRNVETVGGFGIAKLAIFSCEDFEVISSGYRLTKEILKEHLQLLPVECVRGTAIRLEKKDLFPYMAESTVKWFLSGIDRPGIKIVLNGQEVVAYEKKKFDAGDVELKTGIQVWAIPAPLNDTYHSVTVRANGLPVFRNSLYEKTMGSKMSFVYEVKTDLEPYDPLYPFTITRDEFNAASDDKKSFESFKSALSEHFRGLNALEESTKEALMYDDMAGIWTMYNPTICHESLALVEKYKKCIKLLFMLNNIEFENVEFGLIGSSNPTKIGAYTSKAKQDWDVFFINESVKNPERILATAIHEFTHKRHGDHYESFATAMTINTEKVFNYLGMNYNTSILGIAESVVSVKDVTPVNTFVPNFARFETQSILHKLESGEE